MDSSIRVNFRFVIPLLVVLVVLYLMIFRSSDNDKELIIKRLKGQIQQKNKEIQNMKLQFHTQMATKKTITKTIKEPSTTKTVTRKIPEENAIRQFKGKKLMHLDLKGGAPKMTYILQLIPTLKSWGVSGLLVEYEDMFPYDEDLSVLKSPYAYSVSEINKLLAEVKKHDILFVPLVQTFGHMEFVLKNKKFAHLRHVPNMTNAINPADSGSIPLVKSIVKQIIKMHKSHIKYLHIGGDEVWSLKHCESCNGKEEDANNIYLKHMSPVIDYVVFNQVTPIMWDDMMRNWTVHDLKKISSKRVEPMVWGYGADLTHYFPEGMWERYGQAFDKVWIASAFKGAEMAYTNFVSINDRINNHQSWLKITADLSRNNVEISGIALTGWSRFDHDSSLCELLPASLPSLALCLAVLEDGQLSEQSLLSVSRKLGFIKPIILNPRQIPRDLENADEGIFSGHAVFGEALRLRRAYNAITSVEVRLLGWFNDRQVVKKTISNYHLSLSLKRLDSAIQRLAKLKLTVKDKFASIFNLDIIDEWIWDKVDSKRSHAIKIKQRLMKLKSPVSNINTVAQKTLH